MAQRSNVVHVRPYVKKDGTYVRGYVRGAPTRGGAAASRTGGSGGAVVAGALIFLSVVGWGLSGEEPSNAVPAQAWQVSGFTVTRLESSDDPACDAHSYGTVRQYLQEHDCLALHRELLQAEDRQGRQALIATSRTTMPSVTEASSLQDIADRSGAGNIADLARESSDYDQVSFTGQHYDSDLRGTSVLAAEAEALGSNIDAADLKALAEQAVNHQ